MASAWSLSAVIAPSPAQAQSFTDVHPDDWFGPAVEALAAEAVVSGFPDGSFRPYDPVTRSQFAVMLATMLHLPTHYVDPFDDVGPGDWYAGAVGALYEVGIVWGIPGGTFNPSAELERQQAATFIVRALAYRNISQPDLLVDLITDAAEGSSWLVGFKDRGSIGSNHALAVADAFRLGFVSGYDDSRFYPFVTLTRAQAVGMLHTALGMALDPRTEQPQPVAAEDEYPTLKEGAAGPLAAWAERRLAALSYRPGSVDGVFDDETADAMMAFQKVEGLPRTGTAPDNVVRALTGAATPAPRRSAWGSRVEIDLTRQVMLVIGNNRVEATIPVATGRAGWRTPTGTFSVQRKLSYWRKSELGLLYKPAYFRGGYAIHGSYSVPASPASHGCVRVAVSTMDWLYPLLPIGTRVDIYY
jgi:lipoprotein-anchoring transpeptidase ErfK/SrfK